MSKVKRILSVMMAMVMVLAMSVPTFAATTDVTGITSNITVNGLSDKATTTVKLYKLASLQLNDETNEYSWKLANWAAGVELNTDTNSYEIKDMAALKAAVASAEADQSVDVSETSYTFKDVEIGAYVIMATDADAEYNLMVANTYDYANSPADPTGGAPVAINQTVVAKASGHTVSKEADDTFVRVGQDVNFTLTTTFPVYKNAAGETLKNFQITDTPTGLVIDKESVSVKIGTTAVNPTVDVDTTGKLTITFGEDLLTEANAGQLVTVIYTGKVTSEEGYNNNAGAESNTVDYTPTIVTGFTGDITLTKYAEDGSTVLHGAEFTVTKTGDADAEALYFVKKSDGVYKLADAEDEDSTQTVVATSGTVTVKGLDEGTYHFTETKAPSGYSINSEGVNGTITESDKNVSVDISLNDTKLSALPSTGGIGTTIFTIGGCAIMIVAAGLFFATRRKTQK